MTGRGNRKGLAPKFCLVIDLRLVCRESDRTKFAEFFARLSVHQIWGCLQRLGTSPIFKQRLVKQPLGSYRFMDAYACSRDTHPAPEAQWSAGTPYTSGPENQRKPEHCSAMAAACSRAGTPRRPTQTRHWSQS